jgi:hypothetical protein
LCVCVCTILWTTYLYVVCAFLLCCFFSLCVCVCLLFCEQHIYTQFVLFFYVVFLVFVCVCIILWTTYLYAVSAFLLCCFFSLCVYYFWQQLCEAESFSMYVCCPLVHTSMHATDKLRRWECRSGVQQRVLPAPGTRLSLLHMNCLLMTKRQAFVISKYWFV